MLASVVLAVYLAAIVLPPLAGPPPASRLANVLIQPLRPLIGGLSLGHGYRFFAPDPGPGHSIRWTIRLDDGSTRSGSIPDAAADWPRLLYHRRFMISEKIAARVPPTDAPPAVREEARRDWLPLVKGVARNLLRVHGGGQVELAMVEHYLPAPEEVSGGRQGSDVITPLGTYTMAGAAAP
jgi:hypothetical protein